MEGQAQPREPPMERLITGYLINLRFMSVVYLFLFFQSPVMQACMRACEKEKANGKERMIYVWVYYYLINIILVCCNKWLW